MRNLLMPERTYSRADLQKAIRIYRHKGQEKGHELTENELAKILNIYDLYDQRLSLAHDDLKGADLPASLIDSLYSAYDTTQERRRLSSIRERLTKNVSLCPICGIDTAGELDHHLPRSVFKPLAIYERNLIPMCHTCNHTKLAGFGDENGDKIQFLHAYFDTLPDVQFLHAAVEIKNAGLVVEFSILEDLALPGGYAKRLAGQMKSLSLNERYEHEVNTYISSQAVTLHLNFRDGGQDAVRSYLTLQARYEKAAFYRNHWRPTLLSALALNNEFTKGGFADILPIAPDLIADIDRLL